jgi:hypothetical protein
MKRIKLGIPAIMCLFLAFVGLNLTESDVQMGTPLLSINQAVEAVDAQVQQPEAVQPAADAQPAADVKPAEADQSTESVQTATPEVAAPHEDEKKDESQPAEVATEPGSTIPAPPAVPQSPDEKSTEEKKPEEAAKEAAPAAEETGDVIKKVAKEISDVVEKQISENIAAMIQEHIEGLIRDAVDQVKKSFSHLKIGEKSVMPAASEATTTPAETQAAEPEKKEPLERVAERNVVEIAGASSEADALNTQSTTTDEAHDIAPTTTETQGTEVTTSEIGTL